ncbi:MAG: CBM9, partial [uncultured Gemmatimonadetes bacterium]
AGNPSRRRRARAGGPSRRQHEHATGEGVPGDLHHRRARGGRPPGRRGVGRRRLHRQFHAARAQGGGALPLPHHDARGVRQRRRLRRRPRLRSRSWQDRRAAQPPRRGLALGLDVRGLRLAPRPAHGVRLRGEPGRGEARLHHQRRRRRRRGVGRGVVRGRDARLAGVDGGIPHPPVGAALRHGRRRGVGLPGAARGAARERAVVLGARQARRAPPGGPLRRAARDERPPRAAAAGAASVQRVRRGPRAGRPGEPLLLVQRAARLGGAGREVRRHLQPHAGRHLQPRLRAGGRRSVGGEPFGLRDLPFRAAPLLHRGRGHLPLRHRPGRRRRGQRVALLLAPHRPLPPRRRGRAGERVLGQAGADQHPGRRQAERAGGARLVRRRDERPHGPGAGLHHRRQRRAQRAGGGADDQLHGPPRPPRAERRQDAARRGHHGGVPAAGRHGDGLDALARLRRRRGRAPPLGERRLLGARVGAGEQRGGEHRRHPGRAGVQRALLPAPRPELPARGLVRHLARRVGGQLRPGQGEGEVAGRLPGLVPLPRLRDQRPGLPARRGRDRQRVLDAAHPAHAGQGVPRLEPERQRLGSAQLRVGARGAGAERERLRPLPQLLERVGRGGARVRRMGHARPARRRRHPGAGRHRRVDGHQLRRPQAPHRPRQLQLGRARRGLRLALQRLHGPRLAPHAQPALLGLALLLALQHGVAVRDGQEGGRRAALRVRGAGPAHLRDVRAGEQDLHPHALAAALRAALHERGLVRGLPRGDRPPRPQLRGPLHPAGRRARHRRRLPRGRPRLRRSQLQRPRLQPERGAALGVPPGLHLLRSLVALARRLGRHHGRPVPLPPQLRRAAGHAGIQRGDAEGELVGQPV